MARHLLLKNNTVSLSQRVKRKQIQNRENMRDNYFLTYDERQTAFSKNYGYLISTKYWLTFYKYYIVFWTASIASRVLPLSGEEKEEDLGVIRSNEAWKWNNTAKQLVSGYSLCTCSFRFRFGVHFESVKSIVSITPTCLISLRSLSP